MPTTSVDVPLMRTICPMMSASPPNRFVHKVWVPGSTLRAATLLAAGRPYSCRSAVAGGIRDARRAGMRVATAATTARRVVTETTVTGS